MIVSAYYMVNEYNLRLGPCNTVDNLEEVSKYIYKEYHYPSTVKDSVLQAFLETTEDSKIKEYKKTLTYNVPYCLQSPFYTDLKSPSKAKVDEINKCKRLLYYFVVINNMASEIEIVPGLEKNEFIVRLSNILLPVYKSAQLCGFKEWFHEKENV